MFRRLLEHLPLRDLFHHLPEDTLVDVDSDYDRSIYMFACGCVAHRAVGAEVCRVRWCKRHPKVVLLRETAF